MSRQEGLEAFGTAISLFISLFLLIFVAHLLGCFFTLFVTSNTGNWCHQQHQQHNVCISH